MKFVTGPLPKRVERATDILLHSMEVYQSETMRGLVIDALYLLTEGRERGKDS